MIKKHTDTYQLLIQVCTAIINISNDYLEADKSNKIVERRALVTEATDAITVMGKLNTMLTNERKTRLKAIIKTKNRVSINSVKT